jgi:hypothetical protein
MSAQKFSLDGTDTAIWAEPANLNYFLKTALDPDSAAGVSNKQTTVKAHTRRQFVGDTTLVNVSSHSMEYMVDPGRKSGSALPGKPFVITDGIEKRQMRFTGDFMDVHAMFVGDAKFDVDLYSPTGTRYSISAAGEAIAAKVR